jgi:hypothetical protein
VRGIHASAIAAKMIDLELSRNRADSQLISHPMSCRSPVRSQPEHRITSTRVRSEPIPAALFVLPYFCPEPVRKAGPRHRAALAEVGGCSHF